MIFRELWSFSAVWSIPWPADPHPHSVPATNFLGVSPIAPLPVPSTPRVAVLQEVGASGTIPGRNRDAKNVKLAATRKERCQDLIWPEAASQVTAARRKYDSLAMWHASAALWPKTASSV